MTYPQFISRLTEVAKTRAFHLDAGAIRTIVDCQCPVVALVSKYWPNVQARNVGVLQLGLSPMVTYSIMLAADCPVLTPVRKDLLIACGLSSSVEESDGSD